MLPLDNTKLICYNMYTKSKKGVYIMFTLVNPQHFDLRAIMNSGQCFRIFEPEPNVFDVLSMDKWIRIYHDTISNRYTFDCLDNENLFWQSYFDLNFDYHPCFNIIYNSDDSFLKSAADYGYGMRILRQSYWETIISFLISQNNNIPRIKKSIEALCKKFGKPMTKYGVTYYSFPYKSDIANIKLEDLSDLGLGYRDKYIYGVCKCPLSSLGPNKLLNIPGIGPKVESCILLFGTHNLTQCPIDTWMKKILHNVYNNHFDFTPYHGFEGYIQQLMFYYYRNNS